MLDLNSAARLARPCTKIKYVQQPAFSCSLKKEKDSPGLVLFLFGIDPQRIYVLRVLDLGASGTSGRALIGHQKL